MNPNTLFSASLVTSLVLWFPSMQACLRGDLDLAPAGLRYLAALVVSRLAMGGLARLVGAYHAGSSSEAQPGPGRPPASPSSDAGAGSSPAAATPQRRRTDNGAAEADPDSLAA